MFERMSLLLALLLVAGCGPSRPPWADGAMIREPRPAGAAAENLRNLDARLLAVHNAERRAVGTPALVWDAGLAAAAAAYGPELARRGRLVHSPDAERPGQGENLWMGTRGGYRVEEMAGSWAAEKRLFRPGAFPNVSSSGHWSDVGHYTQMIWRSTSRLGCAVHRSERWDFLICRYVAPGNVVGQRVP